MDMLAALNRQTRGDAARFYDQLMQVCLNKRLLQGLSASHLFRAYAPG